MGLDVHAKKIALYGFIHTNCLLILNFEYSHTGLKYSNYVYFLKKKDLGKVFECKCLRNTFTWRCGIEH